MALTITYDFPRPVRTERGNRSAVAMISGTIAFDSSYPTGGEALTDLAAKFKTLLRVVCEQNTGYLFEFDKTNTKLKVYLSSGTPVVSNAAETTHTHGVLLDAGTSDTEAAHTHAAGAITVAGGALGLASPAFSGTGWATTGQDVTTTDNQTMTLNECAGMWFVPTGLASGVPCIILSNTAVTGAPAVLTCQGVPTPTNAGTYKIVKTLTTATGAATAAGSAHSHGPGTLADTASAAGSSHTHTATPTAEPGDEASDTTDLSGLTAVSFYAVGLM